ncbi:PPE domain-containing protein [Mycobacterium sp. HNNTM2301]|uniref:PPE family protein, SVP subgroup n=1 Tax=Mycobacterium hainanense TaxID=3289775 RepID=UPI0035A5A385
MDFGMYPPEINSGRMYAGPGSGPMQAAAQAWSSLADELYTSASAYQSVVSELASEAWSGPSSTAMAAAAQTYVAWLSASAAQAEQTAAQAQAAIAGYEAAFAMTVPPAEIAANRSLLSVLVATNFLGMNTPAIAATEAQYAEMWAQDAAAMYGYAGWSAAATTLTPFSSPHQNTDPGATGSQAAAVNQAGSVAAGDVQNMISAVPQALSGAAAPAQGNGLNTLADLISIFLSAPVDLLVFFYFIPLDALGGPADYPLALIGTGTGLHTDDIVADWAGQESWPSTGLKIPEEFPAVITNPGPLAGSAPSVSAGVGRAGTIGRLSVPLGWTASAPEIRSAAMTSPLPGATPAAAATPLEAGSASSFNQMGIAGMTGQAMAGPPAANETAQDGRPVGRTGRSDDTAAADDVEAIPAPRTVMTGVAAAIRDIAKLRAQGRLSEQEYNEQKKRLLQISFGQ